MVTTAIERQQTEHELRMIQDLARHVVRDDEKGKRGEVERRFEMGRSPVFGIISNGETRIYTQDGTEWTRVTDGYGDVKFVATATIPMD